jgi:hypothetical protein
MTRRIVRLFCWSTKFEITSIVKKWSQEYHKTFHKIDNVLVGMWRLVCYQKPFERQRWVSRWAGDHDFFCLSTFCYFFNELCHITLIYDKIFSMIFCCWSFAGEVVDDGGFCFRDWKIFLYCLLMNWCFNVRLFLFQNLILVNFCRCACWFWDVKVYLLQVEMSSSISSVTSFYKQITSVGFFLNSRIIDTFPSQGE